MLLDNLSELIGNTPLLRALAFRWAAGIKDTEIFAKLECMNPAGSVKDRAALYMINDAEERGLLTRGGTIIEPTSGNTGIAIAAIAAERGYRAIIVMPDTMSAERRAMIGAYGAEIVLTEGAGGMSTAIAKAEEIHRTTENSIIAGQFENPANSRAHYETTGPEIFSDTDGKIDVFVAGIGTGGTISGIGKYLKEKNPEIEVIGVEPAESPLITEGRASPHKIQGIGANFIPKLLDLSVVDRVVTVKSEDAFLYGKLFSKSEGILVGISSGAALAAAAELSRSERYSGKRIVVLIPDSGNRYFSTDMYK